jgi:hypothetical protein
MNNVRDPFCAVAEPHSPLGVPYPQMTKDLLFFFFFFFPKIENNNNSKNVDVYDKL